MEREEATCECETCIYCTRRKNAEAINELMDEFETALRVGQDKASGTESYTEAKD